MTYTREQIKLTDEQREEMRSRNDRLLQIKAKYRSDEQPSNKDLIGDSFEMKHLTDKLSEDIASLLSSEQAWKAEYTEERAAHNEHVTELIETEKRLNQAIEVLKWYADSANFAYQYVIGEDELETPMEEDDGQRARDILTLLGVEDKA